MNINKYQKGKIYKVINDVNDNIYIGSTILQLCQRIASHKQNSKNPKYINCKLYNAFKEIGKEHFKIILLENVSCNTKEELTAKEQEWIDRIKPTYNIMNASGKNEIKRKIREKKYDQERAEQKAQRIVCECGLEVSKGNLPAHKKRKIHLDRINIKV